MEGPDSQPEKAGDRPATGVPKLPFGLRAAILFVRLMIVVAVFPTVGAVLMTLGFLIEGPLSKEPFPRVLTQSLVLVTVSVFLLVMLGGASWMDAMLSRRSFRSFSWVGRKGEHPARQVFMPVAAGVAAYGAMAVILWLPSNWENSMAKTWPWPLVWGSIGTGAFFLYRYLDKILPR